MSHTATLFTLVAAATVVSTWTRPAAAQDIPIQSTPNAILTIPSAPPSTVDAPTRMNSRALVIAGSVLAGIGTGAVIAGGLMAANDTSCAYSGSASLIPYPCGFATLAGIGSALAGGTFILAGVPMITVGAWRVRDTNVNLGASVGGSGGKLTLTF